MRSTLYSMTWSQLSKFKQKFFYKSYWDVLPNFENPGRWFNGYKICCKINIFLQKIFADTADGSTFAKQLAKRLATFLAKLATFAWLNLIDTHSFQVLSIAMLRTWIHRCFGPPLKSVFFKAPWSRWRSKFKYPSAGSLPSKKPKHFQGSFQVLLLLHRKHSTAQQQVHLNVFGIFIAFWRVRRIHIRLLITSTRSTIESWARRFIAESSSTAWRLCVLIC